jgi:hypothetical protein
MNWKNMSTGASGLQRHGGRDIADGLARRIGPCEPKAQDVDQQQHRMHAHVDIGDACRDLQSPSSRARNQQHQQIISLSR